MRDDILSSTSRIKEYNIEDSLKCEPLSGNKTQRMSLTDDMPLFDYFLIESDILLEERTIDEVYYLWCIAGGDAINSFKKAFLVRPEPPVTTLPK